MDSHRSAGAFGRVYKALRNNVQEVAVKVLTHGCDEVMVTQAFLSVPSHAFPHVSDVDHDHWRHLHFMLLNVTGAANR